jgi:hypothetical protein
MTKVKNPDGSLEEFKLSRVIAECEEAGSTPYQAACVAKELGEFIKDKTEITAEELSAEVSKELQEINEIAARQYRERSRHG